MKKQNVCDNSEISRKFGQKILGWLQVTKTEQMEKIVGDDCLVMIEKESLKNGYYRQKARCFMQTHFARKGVKKYIII